MDELSSLLLPLFAYLSEKENDYSINFSDYINQYLNGTTLSELVNKMFSNGNAWRERNALIAKTKIIIWWHTYVEWPPKV